MCKSQRVKGSRKSKVASASPPTSSSSSTTSPQSQSTSKKSSGTYIKPSVGEERVVSTHSLLQTPVALTVNTTSASSTNTDAHRLATSATSMIGDAKDVANQSMQETYSSNNNDSNNSVQDDESASFGEAEEVERAAQVADLAAEEEEEELEYESPSSLESRVNKDNINKEHDERGQSTTTTTEHLNVNNNSDMVMGEYNTTSSNFSRMTENGKDDSSVDSNASSAHGTYLPNMNNNNNINNNTSKQELVKADQTNSSNSTLTTSTTTISSNTSAMPASLLDYESPLNLRLATLTRQPGKAFRAIAAYLPSSRGSMNFEITFEDIASQARLVCKLDEVKSIYFEWIAQFRAAFIALFVPTLQNTNATLLQNAILTAKPSRPPPPPGSYHPRLNEDADHLFFSYLKLREVVNNKKRDLQLNPQLLTVAVLNAYADEWKNYITAPFSCAPQAFLLAAFNFHPQDNSMLNKELLHAQLSMAADAL